MARSGPLHLRRPEFAEMVLTALRVREVEGKFLLHNFVIMPNHVHLLTTPQMDLSKILHSLKRYTGPEGNRLLQVSGQPFWQDESRDRWVRDAIEFERIARYIENNPVIAGLCASPEDYPWSSARRVGNPAQVDNLHHETSLPHKNSHTPTAWCS